MKAELNRSRNLWSLQTIGGSLFFSLLITICAALYLYHRQRAIIRSNRDLSVYITIILITLLLAKGGEWLLLHTTTQWSDVIRYPLIIPFAAILICLLLNEELAIFTSAYLTTFLGITLATNATAFLTLNLLTGTVAAINTNHLRKRKEIFVILARVWLVAAALVFSFNLASGTLLTYTTPH